MPDINQHHSLFEVLSSVQRMFERYWNKPIWVKAELAKINFYPHSGHAYPLLVEKKSGKTVAEIRSTVWATTFKRITSKFESVTKKEFSDGIELLLLVEVRYTPNYGLTLNIIDVDPTYTLGAMERERQQTIKKLKADNLFSKNKSVEFSILPKRVAVISVETSKGFRDFIETLDNNKNSYKVEYKLFPALLQGDKAIESIRRQLDVIRQQNASFDVVAIIRGGGGEVGLSCYDSFSLASAVAQFPLPILTGIGHATNLTVVEMISYENMITPTALGNFILDKFESFDTRILNAESSLTYFSEKIIRDEHSTLNGAAVVIDNYVKLLLQKESFLIEKIQSSIQISGGGVLKKQSELINNLSIDLKYILKEKLQKQNFVLDMMYSKLKTDILTGLKSKNQNLENIEGKVKLLNPNNVLKRGYSITRINGKVEVGIDLKPGDVIDIETYKANIKSRVEKILKK